MEIRDEYEEETKMSNEINVEQIMAEIRNNIKERGYEQLPIEFEEITIDKPAMQPGTAFDAEEFMQEVEYLNYNWNNSFQVPISGGSKIAVFVKKMISKCTRFIVFPIVNYQNAYNASNAKCMMQMKEYMTELDAYRAKVDALEKEVQALKGKSADEK